MNIKKTYLFAFYIFLAIGLLSGSLLIGGCNAPKPNPGYVLTGNIVADGKNLVQINCQKCHALVPVNDLDKNVWKYHTLPSMSKYFKVSSYMGGYYKSDKDTGGMPLNVWLSIVTYYEKMAPDTILPLAKPRPLMDDWTGFKLNMPPPVHGTSLTTMAAVDTATDKIYTSDRGTNELTEWDKDFKMRNVKKLPSPAVDAIFKKDATGASEAILSCIGVLDRYDFPNGRVLQVNLDAKKDTAQPNLIAADIERPVQSIEGDFNHDGLPDIVVLGQGGLKGGVYLYTQGANHTYTQTTISEKPGAVQAITGDFNNDGWTDLMVLFGSVDEGLWLFENDHKGGFTARELLRFPPVYGSSSFQLADLDHDGKPDLIYTCGYNYHDSRILKPYHGLYIYKNTGNWNFKQQWFYPINGCTKAIAADFKGNGKLDIATTAFFADMENDPAESVLYFDQISPFNFKPHAIPVSKYGRWMTMQVADYNHDGKPDIILGNYSAGYLFQPGFKPFWAKNIPFIVLENTFKK
jgi:hypothetical protein